MGTGHGHTLFNEIIHVPLVLINPHLKISENILKSPTSTIDIFPSILDILGVKPDFELDGFSLLREHQNREILSESILYGYEKKALIYDTFKHIYSPYENQHIVFDIKKDPSESTPILSSNQHLVATKLGYYYTKSYPENYHDNQF